MAKKGIYARYECIDTGNHGELSRSNWGSTYVLSPSSRKWLIAELYVIENPRRMGFNYSTSTSCTTQTMAVGTIFTNFNTMSADPVYRADEMQVLSQLENQKTSVCSRAVSIVNVTDYVKGTYLTDVIADYGSLPTDGRHTDGYWYVFLKMASDVKANIGGIWRDVPTAFVNVGGIWKPQSELKTNVNGIYR